jgi:hypothetical protein
MLLDPDPDSHSQKGSGSVSRPVKLISIRVDPDGLSSVILDWKLCHSVTVAASRKLLLKYCITNSLLFKFLHWQKLRKNVHVMTTVQTRRWSHITTKLALLTG